MTTPTGLRRQLGLLGLAATGICSMLGASVYVVPFMIQRNVEGIGNWVLPAFLFAAVPAGLAAIACRFHPGIGHVLACGAVTAFTADAGFRPDAANAR